MRFRARNGTVSRAIAARPWYRTMMLASPRPTVLASPLGLTVATPSFSVSNRA